MVPSKEEVELALALVAAICLLIWNEVSLCILMVHCLAAPRLKACSI